jgi:membrane-bound lytic murein transglycosylase D
MLELHHQVMAWGRTRRLAPIALLLCISLSSIVGGWACVGHVKHPKPTRQANAPTKRTTTTKQVKAKIHSRMEMPAPRSMPFYRIARLAPSEKARVPYAPLRNSWFVPEPQNTFAPVRRVRPIQVRRRVPPSQKSAPPKPVPYPTISLPKHKSFASIKHRFRTYSWGFTQTILRRRGVYQPLIFREIRKMRLPLGLFLVGGIESNYTPRLISSTGAMGMWQFIRSTGKEMGLARTPWVDERRNILKSTRASLRYLRRLYKRFGRWEVAIAAYNCGPGCLGRVLRRCKGKSLWTIRHWKGCGLSREASEYVARFYALLYYWKNPPKDKGWKVFPSVPAMSVASVTVKGIVSLVDVAKGANVPLKELYERNPELTTFLTPPGRKTYELQVPPEAVKRVKAYLSKGHKRRAVVWRAVRVRKGESLARIGYRYRVPAYILKSINRLWGRWPLHKRKWLVIPMPRKGKRWPKRKLKVLVSLRQLSRRYAWRFPAYYRYWYRYRHQCYRVRKGDTLPAIAKRVYVSLANIKRFNADILSSIRPGVKLRLRSYSKCYRKKRKKKKKKPVTSSPRPQQLAN